VDRDHAERLAARALERVHGARVMYIDYDAHHGDPIDGAQMRLSCAGYASLVRRCRDLARECCDGRIVVALEGGYNLTALSWSIRNSVEVLLNEPIAQDPVGLAPELPSAPDIAPLLEAVVYGDNTSAIDARTLPMLLEPYRCDEVMGPPTSGR